MLRVTLIVLAFLLGAGLYFKDDIEQSVRSIAGTGTSGYSSSPGVIKGMRDFGSAVGETFSNAGKQYK